MRLLVIYNPVSGRGRSRRLFEKVIDHLEAWGCHLRVIETAAAGDAEMWLRRLHVRSYDRVVIAGGDGTINEAVNGLADGNADCPLAIIPTGTANVLACEMGLPVNADIIARTIVCGKAVPVALGMADSRYFILMAGAGFDAHVVAGVSPTQKARLGKLAYVLSSFRTFFSYRFPRYRVTVDDRVFEVASVIVTNACHYAGPYVIAPTARLQAARLHICLFERSGRLAAFKYGLGLLLGRLPRMSGFTIVEGKRIQIAGPPLDPVQIDGDLSALLPLDIRMLNEAIDLVVPDSYAALSEVRAAHEQARPAEPARNSAVG